MYKIILSKKVIDFLDTKDEEFVKAFYERIKSLENDPLSNDKLDIKKLKDKEKRFRLWIGKFKFLYEVIEW